MMTMTMKMIKKAITLSLGLVMMGAGSFAQSLADAKKAMDAEQYQKATSMLKTLINNQAKEGDNYYNLGCVYLLTDELDSARAVFTNGIAADPKNALNYVGLGRADLQSNNAASAKTNFDKALSFGAKNYETYLAIGRAYISQKKPDYASALPNLTKAEELDSKDKDPETFVALGDYYALQKKNSEGYNAYLRATDINPALYRVNVQIGKMYKEAYAFAEAEAQLKKSIAGDPNYGPAYRELAELYLQWSYQDPKNGNAKRADALTNMRKYLDLTDQSFESRLRYAQFLVYADDFVTLEKEVATLKAPDKNNPKTFVVIRMRGYSAVENKNYQQGVQYMNELLARTKDADRVIGSDYLYLGKALAATGNDSLAVVNLIKGVELDTTKVEELAEIGKKYYGAKNFDKAIPVFKKVISLNSKNPNMAMNYYYLALADYVKSGAKDRAMLVESDSALAKVIKLAPEYDPAFLYRARINKAIDVIDNPETQKGLAIPFYEQFITLITVTKPEKAAANAKNLVDAYNYLGFFYSETDKEKAKEYFTKTLAIDPANTYAAESLKQLTAPASAKKVPTKKK